MDSGKRFEGRFAKSLHNLCPGASFDNHELRYMRIEDGGGVGKNRQFGDFFFWDEDGLAWCIECKATAEKSFPVRNLSVQQMAALKTWEMINPRHRSVVAVNLYGEKPSKENDCFLIRYNTYENLVRRALEARRASIPREWLSECGKLQTKAPGGLWDLDFGGLE